MPGIKIFTGSSHPELTMHIIDKLGLTSSPAIVKKFPNAEISVELGESVRDADVFLIQSGSHSMNDHLMELLIMISSCKSASAKRITAVLPYFPYNKQSKKKKTRGAISAKLVANMLTVAGVDHIITLELHSSLAQGFFNKPCDNLVALPILAKYITENFDLSKCIMISKNAGGARRVTQLADRLRIDFALIHRERYHVRVGDTATDQLETKITLVGDVKGKICLMLDDVIDGTHSFIDSCEHLKICESDQVYIVAIHGILSGDALKQIEMSNAIDGIITTNSFPVGYDKLRATSKLKQIDISSLFAEAIRRTHNGESMSYLFHTAM
ncbi:phosphoribosyltransferase-like protein [Globomyces pollinis-pini]|nr:phosphoribosyltransferase-like protein [Globomyces pollinis-pini]